MAIVEIGGAKKVVIAPFAGGVLWEKVGEGNYFISLEFTEEMKEIIPTLLPYQLSNLIYYYAKESRRDREEGCMGCNLGDIECRRLSMFDGKTTAEGLTDERKNEAKCRQKKVLQG